MLPIAGNAGWRWEQPQGLGVNGFGEVQRVVVLQIMRGLMTTTSSTNYITVRRAAELAGVSHWVIRKWIKRGLLAVRHPVARIAIC